MSSRNVTVSVLLSVLCAAAAAGAFIRAGKLQSEAGWLLERGTAQGMNYAASFDNVHAEAQLASFAERREVLEAVHRWNTVGQLFVLFAVLGAVCSWALYLYFRLSRTMERVGESAASASAAELAAGPVVTARS